MIPAASRLGYVISRCFVKCLRHIKRALCPVAVPHTRDCKLLRDQIAASVPVIRPEGISQVQPGKPRLFQSFLCHHNLIIFLRIGSLHPLSRRSHDLLPAGTVCPDAGRIYRVVPFRCFDISGYRKNARASDLRIGFTFLPLFFRNPVQNGVIIPAVQTDVLKPLHLKICDSYRKNRKQHK